MFKNPSGGNNGGKDSSSRRVLGIDSPSPSAKSTTLEAADLFKVYRQDKEKKRGAPQGEVMTDLQQKVLHTDYMRQMPRRFETGDVYAPHDLSPVEMRKWRKWTTESRDLVDLLGLSPVDMYRVSSFPPPHISLTGHVNQRATARMCAF